MIINCISSFFLVQLSLHVRSPIASNPIWEEGSGSKEVRSKDGPACIGVEGGCQGMNVPVRVWVDWSSAILSATYARKLAGSSTVASASFSS
jgi:hypothetical protein